MTEVSTAPDWNRLFEVAVAQDGLFTTTQAAKEGYSPQLLAHHLQGKRLSRVRRGVYRLVHFPAGEHEDLTALWLWSNQAGVFSHQTALALHDLSDAMPSQIHLTLPISWNRRRLRVPDEVVLHYADLSDSERQWFGAVPVTNPQRTLVDCALANVPPDLLRAAALDALERGHVSKLDLHEVETALEAFGGLGS